MANSDNQIDKPQRGRPERPEVPDVNILTGAQSINTERTSLIIGNSKKRVSLQGSKFKKKFSRHLATRNKNLVANSHILVAKHN